jgi:8-oxo-dGTP pyrophosphatase MutT (NUDIX family)
MLKTEKLLYLAPLYVIQIDHSYTFHLFHLSLNKKPPLRLSNEHQDYQWLHLKNATNLPLIPGQAKALELYQSLLLQFEKISDHLF